MKELRRLCREFGVRELSVFGSALRPDFTEKSDIDFLVVFRNDDYGPWMGKLSGLQESISALLGRKVDVVPKSMIKRTLRDEILSTAQVVYAEG